MSEYRLGTALYRSLSTAWTPAPAGPRWAPWAWTLLINTMIGLVLWMLTSGRTGGLVQTVVISQGIGLSIHLIFWGLGKTLKIEMFTLPARVRVAYVATVVVVGTWIGFSLALLLVTRDSRLVIKVLQGAWGGLITFPLVSALIMVVMLTAVSRWRANQLAAERAQGERIRADREAMAARLALLNAQIEPHFLYNTLAHVRALTGRDAQAAQRMIDSLIDYLRASSRNMALPLVPLDDELASVRGYLAVMQQRLGERLRVHWQVPPEACAVPVPPASLQTLVENAIKHGVEPSTEGGEIRVEVRRESVGWLLDVLNTGAIFGSTAQVGGASSPGGIGGTGLPNLRERLRLALGAGASLTLDSRAGTTRARITLPGLRSPSDTRAAAWD